VPYPTHKNDRNSVEVPSKWQNQRLTNFYEKLICFRIPKPKKYIYIYIYGSDIRGDMAILSPPFVLLGLV
jgi:hypothetical protein